MVEQEQTKKVGTYVVWTEDADWRALGQGLTISFVFEGYAPMSFAAGETGETTRVKSEEEWTD